MKKTRKESRKFYLSVEGVNCEKLYFQHLQKLINSFDESRYNVSFDIKPQISPMSMYKRIAHKPVDKVKNRPIPYIHIQDIENYQNVTLRKKFEQTIDEMVDVEKDSEAPYVLGYSNFTFELWMLLHVADMKGPVTNGYSNLSYINRCFGRNYKTLDEYKPEREFTGILSEFITMDSVKAAIVRAQALRQIHSVTKDRMVNYRGFRYFIDNPDTTVDRVVMMIFEICGIS